MSLTAYSVTTAIPSSSTWLRDPRCLSSSISYINIKDNPRYPVENSIGSLSNGLINYLSFDNSLSAFNLAGYETTAKFTRSSVAFSPKMTQFSPHIPRFLPSQFGDGIFIEYGHSMAGVNQLPPSIASALPTPFSTRGKCTIKPLPGLEGNALSVQTVTPDAALLSPTVKIPLTKNMTFSFYARSDEQTSINLTVQTKASTGTDSRIVETNRTINLTSNWNRFTLNLQDTKVKLPRHKVPKEKNRDFNFIMQTTKPSHFQIDALMLETHAGYGWRGSASTWMPGESRRAGEILRLPPVPNAESGTVAFWFQPYGKLSWRTLLCIDNGVGWWPDLRLDLIDNRRLRLVWRDLKPNLDKLLSSPIMSGSWHHAAVTWKKNHIALFLDGEPILKTTNAPPCELTGGIHLGGVPNNVSPAVRADALFDEFAQWERALSANEINTLVERTTPLSDDIDQRMTLTDLEPINIFPRDYNARLWKIQISNRAPITLKETTLRWGITGIFEQNKKIQTIPGNSAAIVPLTWSPAHLMPGEYTIHFIWTTKDGQQVRYERNIEIISARTPSSNVQTITWGGLDTNMVRMGMTTAGLTATHDGVRTYEMKSAVRNGLYVMARQTIHGIATIPDDNMLTVNGKPHHVDQRAPGPLKDLMAKSRRLVTRVANFPDLRNIILNTENLWVNLLDFRTSTIELAKEQFGLDLSRWLNHDPKAAWRLIPPGGRLSPSMAAYPTPNDGILPLNDPLYSFLRWWHSDQPGNEIFLNDYVATTIRKQAPWIKSIAEPVLRRPFVRAFKAQDIIEEWFYYPDPARAISVQETVTAAARGSNTGIAGMPQFLLKPGMAAPYAGVPTPHMFRETVWLCISRPLEQLMYWNLQAAYQAKKTHIVQDEIDKRIAELLKPGETLDFKTVREKINVTGERSEFALFIPELGDEVTRLHNEVVHPLGALLPQWQNRPRRIALYQSFAGNIFSEIRWSSGQGLQQVLRNIPQPYDVLFDQDFEEDTNILKKYDLLLINESSVITAPAAKQIRTFISNKGTVIVDQVFGADITGIVRFDWKHKRNNNRPSLDKRRQELLSLYGRVDHPQYIEGMEQAAKTATAEGPTAAATKLIHETILPEANTDTPHIFLNILEAKGANYIVAVNDLRIKGSHYGHFNRVLENGVAQTASIRCNVDLGNVGYELLACKKVSFTKHQELLNFNLDLPPAGGRVVILLPKEISQLKLTCAQSTTIQQGETLTVNALLLDKNNTQIPGIIPAHLNITRPDGTVDGYSHNSAFHKGNLQFKYPIPINAPLGRWSIKVRDLAANMEKIITFNVIP